MTAQTKVTLKSYFEAGDRPNQAQFADLVDTIGGDVLVAASDAPDVLKGRADYICDGTNDEVQIQAAIDALPAGGGKILLSPGTFVCSKAGVSASPATGYCILIDAADGDIILAGSGWGTIIKMADSQDADTSLIYLRGESGANRTAQTAIRDLRIDGNLAGQSVAWVDFATLEIAYTENATVSGCYFENPNLLSLRCFRQSKNIKFLNNYFDVNAKAALRTENQDVIISGNYFKSSGVGAHISIATNADIDVVSEFVSIQNNVFDGSSAPPVLVDMGGAKHCVLFGNTFKNMLNASGWALKITHYDSALTDYGGFENVVVGNLFENVRQGIQLGSGANEQLANYRNLIANNVIIEGAGISLANGIVEAGANTDNNVIIDNIIQGASTAIVKAGANTRVSGNKGYVTENDGVASSVADGGTIAHGCAAAPTVAICSGSVAGEIVTVTSIDATNITVAIKANDGSAGTSQTIYWQASV